MKKRVVAAGTFDGIHLGHESFLAQARSLGDELIVIVARDARSAAMKGHPPRLTEQARLTAVQALPMVDEVILGDETGDMLSPVVKYAPDVLALGYDQWPDEVALKKALHERGLDKVTVVRLGAFEPDTYHSSILNS